MKKQITFFITLCVIAVLFLVGTGDGSKIVKAEGEVVGNLNNNSTVDAEDMNELSNYLVDKSNLVTEATQADVNGDELADVRDLIRYKRYLTEASDTLSGQGTVEEPYLIASLADMYKFLNDSQNSNESAEKYYQVTADIVVNVGDATSLNPAKTLIREWNTIGTSGTPFAGTLNGNGNTISGIYLSGATDLTNLLGWANEGTVTGLYVDSSYINPTFSTTTSVKYTGDVTNSEIPTCEASITTGEDTVFYQEFTGAMGEANSDTESETVDVVVLKDVTLSARVDISRNITIKNASGKTVTIARDISLATNLNMFYSNAKVKFGLKAQRNGDSGALIIDAKNISTTGSVVQIARTSGEFYLGEYVTIKNARHAPGAALRNMGIAVLEGNMIDNETTTKNGGAILNEGTLTINKGTYSGNKCTSANGGGFIYNSGGNVTIAGGTFLENSATVGAVIYNTNDKDSSGTVTIKGGTFSGNKATSTGGGAIYHNSTGAVAISNASFSGNQALCGGAIYNSGTGTTTIENTSFEGNGTEKINSTTITGGAIYNASTSGAVTISDSTFTNNGGRGIGEKGGAIYCASTAGTSISGGTFRGNSAACGGAICASAGSVALNAVEITKNFAWNDESGGGALHLMETATASITEGALIYDNVNGKITANVAKTVDISFANNGTCTLYLLDDTFKSGYLGCYSSDKTETGDSSNNIVLSYNDNTVIPMPYNQYKRVNFETKELY